MKVLWFDTETTGTNPRENDIIQISGIIEIDGKIKKEFDFKCRPCEPENVQSEAMKIHGYSKAEIMEWPSPVKLHSDLTDLFGEYINKFDRQDKFIPAGYNVKFDIDFLYNFFKKNNDNYFGSWTNWQGLDVINLVMLARYLGKIEPTNNIKLETICEVLGIEIKAHDAMSDILATRELGLKLIELIKTNA